MLKLHVPASELFDERTNEFTYTNDFEVELEHSLVSLSKWESKYNKPFLSKKERTNEELLFYIKCMANKELTDQQVLLLVRTSIKQIEDYIQAPMTATWFSKQEGASRYRGSGETVTSELIYYWMIALNIPFECQHWHLNRLLTLIQVCNLKNKPPKKMSKSSILKNNAALNRARRAKMHSKG